jgi:hypothetical protein
LGSLGAAAFAKDKNGGPSYAERFMDWVSKGQQGPAPTYGNTGGTPQTGGQPGGSLPGSTPNVISDGHGGFVDTKTGLPVNEDGTPLPLDTNYPLPEPAPDEEPGP